MISQSTAPAPDFTFWDGEQLRSHRGLPLAFDVETEAIQDERQIPKLALAVASDGNNHVVIHPQKLGMFLTQHREEFFVGHNVQFDFWCVDQHLAIQEPAARRILWDACDQGRLRDTMILDMLIQLATGNYRAAKGNKSTEQKVYPASLAALASEFTTLQLNKDDPYRLRFRELIGSLPEALPHTDPGFFHYAVADAVATYRLYPALSQEADGVMRESGYRRVAERYDIFPDAVERYGYLSEVVQVKASIVLSSMFRRGVTVDEAAAQHLVGERRRRVEQLADELRQDFPGVLTCGSDGSIRVTQKSRTPSLSHTRLTAMLAQVVNELRRQGQTIEIPQSQGKNPGVSRSVKKWEKYKDRHRFLALWIEMKAIEKQLGFLTRLNARTLHCQYSLLTRTGRTSCSSPRDDSIPGVNLQQMPKDTMFRDLFVPRTPDSRLLIADYSAIELRTLAAVCLARFGRSELANVIRRGVDPHSFTAAAIQGMPFKTFMRLKRDNPNSYRRRRQAAKAINFGVPGGLGAKTLREYALANYDVSLTEKEAAQFRETLILKVYPELNDRDGYLADQSMSSLSRNLGVAESLLWDAFDWSGERNSIAARGVANVIGGRSKASPNYQQQVWSGLRHLCRTCSESAGDVMEAIDSERGNQALHERLYRQTAATLTGRIRAGVKFTDSKNTPFQSLAADGSKLALWNLLYAGFDVYGFVHDEILVNLPEHSAESDAKRAVAIMEASMAEVLCGLPADCEWVVGDRWTKPA